MNLKNKKRLAARTLGVGAGRIVFVSERIPEIAEAITKQDIRDLFDSKAIYVKDIKGRLTKERRGKGGPGKTKKNVGRRKEEYMAITRKLRKFAKQLLLQGKITKEHYRGVRGQIRARTFRSKAHFKEIAKPGTEQIKSERNVVKKKESKVNKTEKKI